MKKSTLSIAILAISTLCHQGTHSFLGPCTPLLAPVKVAAVNAALASKVRNLTADQFQEALGFYKDFCNKEGVVGAVRLNAKGTHLVIRGRTLSNKNNKIALDALNNHFELEEMAKLADAEFAKEAAARVIKEQEDRFAKEQQKADIKRAYSYKYNNKEWVAEWNQLLDAQKEELEVSNALKQRQKDVSDLNDKYVQAWVDYAAQMKALHEAEVADAALTQRQLDEQAWEGPCHFDKSQDSFDWKQFAKNNKEPLIAAGVVAAGAAGLYAGKKLNEQAVEV